MTAEKLKSPEDILDESDVYVRKIGGDNAQGFKSNFEIATEIKAKGKKQIMVLSAIRSSDAMFNDVAIVRDKDVNGKWKNGFNTTSHLIRLAQEILKNDRENATKILAALGNFFKVVIEKEIEPEFRDAMIDVLHANLRILQNKTDKAFALHKGVRTDAVKSVGKDFIFFDADESPFSFTGFGEILTDNLYAKYFELKGLVAAQVNVNDQSEIIFGEDPKKANEVLEKENATIDQVRNMFSARLRDVTADVMTTGSYMPGVGSYRGYGDIAGAIAAEAIKVNQSTVVYINEKEDPVKSADPKVVKDAVVVERMTPNMALETFGSNGADAGAVHPAAIRRIKGAKIPTLVMNPRKPEKGITYIDSEFEPPADGVEIVSSKSIPYGIEIESDHMVDHSGVVLEIMEYFEDFSISEIYTTERTIVVTFSEEVKGKSTGDLKKILAKKYSSEYRVHETQKSSIVYCIGNNMDTLKELVLAGNSLLTDQINVHVSSFNDAASVLTFQVPFDQADRAVQVLHKALITERQTV